MLNHFDQGQIKVYTLPMRLLQAMEDGMTQDELFEFTNIDPWFLQQFAEIHQAEMWIKSKALNDLSKDDFIQVKKRGFSDVQVAMCTGMILQCHLDL